MNIRIAAEALTPMIVERSLNNYCNQLAGETKDKAYFDNITDYAAKEYSRIYMNIINILDPDHRNAL